jgi:regulator of chromosome condensation
MLSPSANIGRKRTAFIEDHPAKSPIPHRTRNINNDKSTNIASVSMAPKRAVAATSESKPAKRQRASNPDSKSITSSKAKRSVGEDAESQPVKRQRSTKSDKSSISAPKKSTSKPVSKKLSTVKETKASKDKTVIESKLNAVKVPKTLAAKKSPAETRKIDPEINTAPTEKLRVFACGEGSAGELGLGPKGREVKRPRYNALLDPEKTGVVQMSAGGMHVIALTYDNKILSWGVNDQGALGRDTTWDGGLRDVDASDSDSDDEDLNPKESTPLPIDPSHFAKDTRFVQVAAGDSCSFALTTTGYVYGWGTFRVS